MIYEDWEQDMPEISWKAHAVKQLSKIPAKQSDGIREKVNELAKWPDIPHLKVGKLTDDAKERHKLVVGNYRVIWKIVEGVPLIIEIQEVLRRTTRTYSKR